MEGGVYLCSWTTTADGYKIVLSDRPSVTAAGETFDEAEEGFCIVLGELFGDGEPNLEYDRPPPRVGIQARYLGPDIVQIFTPRTFQVTNPSAVFHHDRCSACGKDVSLRTEAPVSCAGIPRGCAGAWSITSDDARKIGWGRLQIFSETFLALFSDQERSALNLRPVRQAKSSTKRYFEILGSPIAKTVGVRGFPGLKWRKCRACERCCFLYFIGTEMFTFLAVGDLPSPLPTIFVVEDHNSWLHLCMPRQRFTELRSLPASRGLQSTQIYVAPDREVIRDNDAEDYPEELLYPRCGRPLEHEPQVPCARSGCDEFAILGREICLWHFFKG